MLLVDGQEPIDSGVAGTKVKLTFAIYSCIVFGQELELTPFIFSNNYFIYISCKYN